jgi:hypothetical protein
VKTWVFVLEIPLGGTLAYVIWGKWGEKKGEMQDKDEESGNKRKKEKEKEKIRSKSVK